MRLSAPFLFLALFSLNQPVWAKQLDPDLPPLDPPGHIRIMAMTDKDSTSRCIGHPVTPLCAIEQLIAGHFRNDQHLWDLAFGEANYPMVKNEFEVSPGKPNVAQYRVVLAEKVTQGWSDRNLSFWDNARCGRIPDEAQPGDVRIDILLEFAPYIVNEGSAPEIFLVRKDTSKKWKIAETCPPRINSQEDIYWK